MGDTPTHMQAVRSDLRDEIHQLNEKVDAVCTRNQDDHRAIMSQVTELVSDKKALRLFGILLGIALGSVVTAMIWGTDRIDEVEDAALQHEAEGMEIGRGLRRDVLRHELEIDRLRQQHGLKPGKE